MNARRHTVRLPTSSEECFAERVALFALASGTPNARVLLESLSQAQREQALATFDQASEADPVARRGRVAQLLGARDDARERLGRVVRSVGPELMSALRSATPSYLRETVPSPRVDGAAGEPVRAFAARLVREAMG